MATLPPPPAGLDIYESKVPDMYGAMISTYILAFAAVGLRFYARRLCRQPLWWDDWLIVLSLIAAGGTFFGSLFYSIPHGIGHHIWVAPPDAVYSWAKGLFAYEVTYTVNLVAAKYSVLCFYWKIFKFSRIRVPIYILAALVTAWGIAVLLITFLQCMPLHALWDEYLNPSLMSACTVQPRSFFIGNSVPNIVTDALLVLLPIPFIWQLHLGRSQKIALTNVFILGAATVAVSITRLIFLLKLDLVSPDITWNFVPTQLLTTVESHITIVCACLPSLRPLLSLMLTGSVERSSGPSHQPPPQPRAFAARPWTSKYWNGSAIITKTEDHDEHPFSRISTDNDHDHTETGNSTPRIKPSHGFDFELDNVRSLKSPGGINVETEIRIEHEPR